MSTRRKCRFLTTTATSPPADIAGNTNFRNLAHAWLGGDHYKWRAMRSNGVPEADITGHEADYRTFLAWAQTVPRLVGNPLYHWTHLELQRYFGIHEALHLKKPHRPSGKPATPKSGCPNLAPAPC